MISNEVSGSHEIEYAIHCPDFNGKGADVDRKEIWDIAMAQSATDLGCSAGDFERPENIVVRSKANPDARKYLELPFACNLVSYGTNIVASVQEEYEDIVKRYIRTYPVERCFETPNLHVLDQAFHESGLMSCFMAEYFLPDPRAFKEWDCPYELRVMRQDDFAELYVDAWSNALCEKRKELDVLGVGAYDKGKLIGLAACSADCEKMWQIGVDVLPEYRRNGTAKALTSRLAIEILRRGKVPFYCAAWSNIRSVRNAVSSGFRPAWVELTIKTQKFVDEMNRSGT